MTTAESRHVGQRPQQPKRADVVIIGGEPPKLL